MKLKKKKAKLFTLVRFYQNALKLSALHFEQIQNERLIMLTAENHGIVLRSQSENWDYFNPLVLVVILKRCFVY